MSEFDWTLRITATDQEAVHAVARRHQFAVGRPLHFDAEYPLLTALEYALGAIGAEVVNGLRLAAKRRRIEIDDIEAIVKGELDNPLTYLEVVGAEGHPGLKRVHVKVYVASPRDQRTFSTLWNDIRDRLPLVRTFSGALTLTVELNVAAG
jgi:hypothetical protein